MHHLHISGLSLLLIVVFVLALLAIVLGFISSSRRDRREAEIEMERVKRGDRSTSDATGGNGRFGNGSIGAGAIGAAPAAYTGSHGGSPVYAAAPVVAPVYGGSDPMLGLATGMMIGSAMGHHHDTVIVDRGGYAPAYVEPAYASPSYDSGISYDSGPSYSSGDSGGVDISFGGGGD